MIDPGFSINEKHIGEALRQLRAIKGYSREQVSMRTRGPAPIHSNTVRNAEEGKTVMIISLLSIAHALDCDIVSVVTRAAEIATQSIGKRTQSVG